MGDALVYSILTGPYRSELVADKQISYIYFLVKLENFQWNVTLTSRGVSRAAEPPPPIAADFLKFFSRRRRETKIGTRLVKILTLNSSLCDLFALFSVRKPELSSCLHKIFKNFAKTAKLSEKRSINSSRRRRSLRGSEPPPLTEEKIFENFSRRRWSINRLTSLLTSIPHPHPHPIDYSWHQISRYHIFTFWSNLKTRGWGYIHNRDASLKVFKFDREVNIWYLLICSVWRQTAVDAWYLISPVEVGTSGDIL